MWNQIDLQHRLHFESDLISWFYSRWWIYFRLPDFIPISDAFAVMIVFVYDCWCSGADYFTSWSDLIAFLIIIKERLEETDTRAGSVRRCGVCSGNEPWMRGDEDDDDDAGDTGILNIKLLYWDLWFHEEPLTSSGYFHRTNASLGY